MINPFKFINICFMLQRLQKTKMEFDSRQTKNLRSILIKKIVEVESYYCSACKDKENFSSDSSSAVHTTINENEKMFWADIALFNLIVNNSINEKEETYIKHFIANGIKKINIPKHC